jgi:hypothetical protein
MRPSSLLPRKLREILRTEFGSRRESAMQASDDDVVRPDIVVGRHDGMRQHRLVARARIFDAGPVQFGKLADNAVGPEFGKDIELSPARGFCATIREIDDHALIDTIDRKMRFVNEAPQAFGQPVIASGLAAIAVHALLDHNPVFVIARRDRTYR